MSFHAKTSARLANAALLSAAALSLYELTQSGDVNSEFSRISRLDPACVEGSMPVWINRGDGKVNALRLEPTVEVQTSLLVTLGTIHNSLADIAHDFGKLGEKKYLLTPSRREALIERLDGDLNTLTVSEEFAGSTVSAEQKSALAAVCKDVNQVTSTLQGMDYVIAIGLPEHQDSGNVESIVHKAIASTDYAIKLIMGNKPQRPAAPHTDDAPSVIIMGGE